MPLWCPWPLPTGWTVTGVAWAGDDRSGVSRDGLACSGPAPFGDGPADVVLVAEEPGVGLGARLAGLPGPDPGPALLDADGGHGAAREGEGRRAPDSTVGGRRPEDRSAYVGEARGRWLYAVAWPAQAGYLLAEDVVLQDLSRLAAAGTGVRRAVPRLRPHPVSRVVTFLIGRWSTDWHGCALMILGGNVTDTLSLPRPPVVEWTGSGGG